MAISVVQSANAGNQASSTFAGNFSGNVTAGNTVLLSVCTFSGSNVTISAASPTLGGSSVTGSSQLVKIQSAFTASLTTYTDIWLLPNVTGGATSFGITVTNGTLSNSQTGLLAWEVSGLGATPTLDQSSTATGASTSATSGTTGATTQNAEIVLGVLLGIDGLSGTPGNPAGYTNLNIGGSNNASCGGYQIQSSSGSTYTYANSNGGTDPWTGAIVTLYAPSGQSVSGAVSALALAAPAGSILFPASAAGAVSPLALAAPAGTPAGSGAATVAGAVAQMTLAAPAGVASGPSNTLILNRRGVIESPYDDTAGMLGAEGVGNEY